MKNREPEIVTRNGKPVSVIIPIKEYEELLERVEDAQDVAWLKSASVRNSSTGPSRTTSQSGVANKLCIASFSNARPKKISND
jgi:PHD/YefM family antitoxin component YafN of YafNO toxin-antitoxin module